MRDSQIPCCFPHEKISFFEKYGPTRLIRNISLFFIGEFVRSPQESGVGSTAAVSC